LLCSLLVLAGGCKRIRHSTAHVDVTGQVRYQGKPLPGGRVTFVAVEGSFASTGTIDEKGNYKINAPVGPVKISVNNTMLDPQRGAGHAAARRGPAGPGAQRPPGGGAEEPTEIKGTWVRIPPKYASAETSGLTFTVTKESKTHDIELTE
jgi:hypothetical protein